MFEIGTVCVKLAGREAGKICAVVDVVDEHFVLVDGEVRRKKCNLKHLEPLGKKIDLSKEMSHEEVIAAIKAAGIMLKEQKQHKWKKEKGKTKAAEEE